MPRLIKCALILILCAAASAHASFQAQPAPPAPLDPISQLLELPAPLPAAAYEYADPWEQEKPPPIPGADASPKLLLKYWTRPALLKERDVPKPSAAVRERLLQAAADDPAALPVLLLHNLLPDTPATHDLLKSWLDARTPVTALPEMKAPTSATLTQTQDYYWQQSVRDWLMTHSVYLRDELARRAGKLQEVYGGIVHDEGLLAALARLDWERARPLLENHVAAGSSSRAALALTLQYQHAVAAGDAAQERTLRARLLQIAGDQQATPYARYKASLTLMRNEWPGRDEWYLSLFTDETRHRTREFIGLDSLAAPLSDNPDKWLPIITRLIGHQDRNVHEAAVQVLLEFNRWHAQRASVLPLLPWLSDPAWSAYPGRVALLRILTRVPIAESVPGLIKIVETEDDLILRDAVPALAKQCATQAGPALRTAAQRTRDGWVRASIARALIDCGALTEAEQLAAIELYAARLRPPVALGLDYTLSGLGGEELASRIGQMLGEREHAPLALAPALLARVDELRRAQPAVAEQLLLVVQRWPVPAVWQNLAARIDAGTADRWAIGQALRQRAEVRAHAADVLQAALRRGGRAAGIAAVLLGNEAVELALLKGRDRAAQTALLACARLVRDELPIARVGDLYAVKDEALRKAVDHYLDSEGSRAAHELLLAQHPGEVLILGGGNSFAACGAEELCRWRQRLRAAVRQDEADEVWAMAIALRHNIALSVVIRAQHGQAVVVKQKDNAPAERRALTAAEWRSVRELFAATEFAELAPLIRYPARDEESLSLNADFIHLNKRAGRRVFTNKITNNFSLTSGSTAYDRLYIFFTQLSETDGFALR